MTKIYIIMFCLVMWSCNKRADLSGDFLSQYEYNSFITTFNDYILLTSGNTLSSYKNYSDSLTLISSYSFGSGNITRLTTSGDIIFIGINDEKYALSINTIGEIELKGIIPEINACSDIILVGNYVYATVRSSNNLCYTSENVLKIYKIQNTITQPEFVKSIPMNSPYNLTSSSGYMYVCDGASGLEIFTTDDPENPILQYTLKDGFYVSAQVVAPNYLQVLFDTSIGYYDISNPLHPILISRI